MNTICYECNISETDRGEEIKGKESKKMKKSREKLGR
jgi:hypothetical protein